RDRTLLTQESIASGSRRDRAAWRSGAAGHPNARISIAYARRTRAAPAQTRGPRVVLVRRGTRDRYDRPAASPPSRSQRQTHGRVQRRARSRTGAWRRSYGIDGASRRRSGGRQGEEKAFEHGYRLTLAGRANEYVPADRLTKYLESLRP